MNMSYLQDKDFLELLDKQQHKEVFARVTALTMDEAPVEQIEGKVTSGSINIDGSSAVRRTCNLTLVSQNVNINDFYWGIKTKIKLEIGLKNNVPELTKYNFTYEQDVNGNTLYYIIINNIEYQSVYSNIQGVYEITGFLSLKDKKTIIQLNPEQRKQILPRVIKQESYIEKNSYPNIIWFPQGTFVIATFNTTINTNSCTISISGKDKMCMLNGDLGGALPASIDFGQEEILNTQYIEHTFQDKIEYKTHTYYIRDTRTPYIEYKGVFNEFQTYYTKNSDGTYKKVTITEFEPRKTYYIENYTLATQQFNSSTKYYDQQIDKILKKLPLYRIIKESVHSWANEPYHNIVINDLETYGLEQLTYKGEDTLYAFKSCADEAYSQMTIKGETTFYKVKDNQKYLQTDGTVLSSQIDKTRQYKLSDFKNPELGLSAEKPVGGIAATDPQSLTWIVRSIPAGRNPTPQTVLLLNYGDDAGYRITDLTYTGQLISSIGETLTSILDKIKNMLGDFEYFYNLEGQFVFQRKRTFVNTSWTSIQKVGDDTVVEPAEYASAVSYNFVGNKVITSFSNQPTINNLKNDYSIWGQRKGIDNQTIGIHARFAIDKKPFYYKTYKGAIYATEDGEEKYKALINELNQDLKNFNPGAQILGNAYKKEPVPDFLSNDWWDLTDWANYYFSLTGAIPEGALMAYETDPFNGVINFPQAPNTEVTNQFIFDYDYELGTPYYRNNWSPFQHKYHGCGHTYLLMLEYEETKECFKSYVYKPKIPGLDYSAEQVGDIVYTAVKPDKIVDWREIIYQMALDFFQYNQKDDFLAVIGANNNVLYPTGYTGYEQYYTDLQGFWRQLYNPDAECQLVWKSGQYEVEKNILDQTTGVYESSWEWQSPELTDINSEFYLPVLFDEDEIIDGSNWDTVISSNNDKLISKYYSFAVNEKTDNRQYWARAVFETPEILNFWFDFLDSESELASFGVPLLGDRSLVINDSNVSGIYFKEIPNFIYTTSSTFNREQFIDKTGYQFLFLPAGMEALFTISYRGKSAKNEVDNQLYQHSYCTENITINCLPVYYLEPNTRILVDDEDSGVHGEYILTKMTIPLTYNGTMSITANKAPTRIY